MRSSGRIDERDECPAFRIRVGVRAIRHHGYGEGTDGFAVGVGVSAGAQTDFVMCDVSGVCSTC